MSSITGSKILEGTVDKAIGPTDFWKRANSEIKTYPDAFFENFFDAIVEVVSIRGFAQAPTMRMIKAIKNKKAAFADKKIHIGRKLFIFTMVCVNPSRYNSEVIILVYDDLVMAVDEILRFSAQKKGGDAAGAKKAAKADARWRGAFKPFALKMRNQDSCATKANIIRQFRDDPRSANLKIPLNDRGLEKALQLWEEKGILPASHAGRTSLTRGQTSLPRG